MTTAQEVYDALLYKPKTVYEICDEIERWKGERPRPVMVGMRLKDLEAEGKVMGFRVEDVYPYSMWARNPHYKAQGDHPASQE